MVKIYVSGKKYDLAANGRTDDTKKLNMALERAGKTGAVVSLPAGTYRINGHLRIPPNVTLEGVLRTPPMPQQSNFVSTGVLGTTLLAYAGRNDPDGLPFITLKGQGSVVKGLSIYYPEQVHPTGENDEFIPYPWTIRNGPTRGPIDGKFDGANNAVIDVLLVNSYKGIYLSEHSRRHVIRRVYGQPLFRGIEIDGCFDVGRIEDVHFWPFWINWQHNKRVRQLIARDAVALILRRTDWQIVENFFCFGYQTGIRLEQSPTDHGTNEQGQVKPREANGQLTNLNLDSVGIGIDVHATKPQGVQVANVNAALGSYKDLYSERRAIWGREGMKGALSVRGLSVWGGFDEVVQWEAENGQLLLSSSILAAWAGPSAINIEKGRAMIHGNCFTQPLGKKSVTVGSGAGTVTIFHNQLSGNPIENHGPRTTMSDNPQEA